MLRRLWQRWRYRRDRSAESRTPTGLRSESLESRVLFSADLPWVAPIAPEADLFEQSYEQTVTAATSSPVSVVQISQADRQNLMVVDPSFVSDQQASASTLRSGFESAGFEVALLADTEQGISQLDALFATATGFGSVDVLTTAQVGGLKLGSEVVGVNEVLNNSSLISGWASQFEVGSTLAFQAVGLDRFADADHMAGLLTTLTGINVQISLFDEAGTSALTQPVQESRHEVVFVDTSVDNYQSLLTDIQAATGTDRTLEVILLDANRDGVEQIGESLQHYQNLDAVHIVAHGSDGTVELGSSALSSATLDSYADLLAGWQAALSEDADLLIYGCDLAASSIGEDLIRRVSDLTGADVAASDDLTGSAALDGDWDLEFVEGDIETQLAFTATLQSNWNHVLATTSETLVNQTLAGTQETNLFGAGALAADANGNYVVVWQDSSSGTFDVYGRLYSADGTPRSNEFLINSTTVDDQRSASVAMSDAGDFVVTWTSYGQDEAGTYGIYAQRFDATGAPQGAEFQVNSNTNLDQWRSKVAMDSAGNFTIVFTDQDSNLGDVFIQRYAADGSALGGATRVNQTTSDEQSYADIAVDGATGNILVTWDSWAQDGDQTGVYAALLDASGTELVSEFRVNVTTTGAQQNAKVDFASDGSFVVVWDSGANGAEDLVARSYAADGTPTSGEIAVNTYTPGAQRYSDVAVHDDGRFVVTWSGEVSGGGVGIQAQLFASDGSKLGPSFQVNETTSGFRQDPSVDFVGGSAVFSWQGEGVGDSAGVYTRIIQLSNVEANDDNVTTAVDIPIVIDVLGNDTDLESDTLVVLDVGTAGNGTVVNNGDGTVTYTPDVGFTGTDSFDYVAADSTSALQNYWALNGDAVGSVGGVNGILNGTSTVAGEIGTALGFNESSDYAQIPVVSYDAESSISFDFKLDDNSGSLFQYLYSHGDVNSTNSVNVFVNEASHGTDPNVLRTVIRDGDDTLDNAALQIDIAALVGDGQWHNYTVTTGAAGIQVYIDGVLVASDATRGTGTINPAGDLYLGARQDLAADRFYGGALDSLSIYGAALTASQVADLQSGSDRATVNVTVQAASNPTQVVPGGQNVFEDTSLTFSSAGGNAVTVTDSLVATDARLQVFISTNFNGTLTLSQTTGISILGGSNGSSFMTIQGTESDINAAFEGMTFTPSVDFSGSVTLDMTTSLGADMTGHYTFDGGTAIDQSVGLSQNGSLLNGAAIVTDAERGDVLELDGNNREYVEINSTFGEPTDVTLAAWVNFTAADLFGGEVISIGNDVLIRVNEGGTGFVAYFYDGTGHQLIASNVPIDDGNWHHIALTFDDAADTQRLYVDGELATETNITDSIAYSGWWPITRIGAHANDADTEFDFSGRIDDARIYTRALSAAEIVALAADNTSSSDSVIITVAPINDAPTIDDFGSDFQSALNDGIAVTLDAAALATIADDGPGNFDGGTITVTGTGFDGLDQLGIETSGTISLSAGVNTGSVLSVGGVAVGTLGAVSNAGFTLSMNADSTEARIEDVLQSLTFQSTSMLFGTRSVDVVLADGDGVANGGADTVSVSLSVNLASSGQGVVTTTEDTTYTYGITDFDFTGVVGTNLRNITVTSLPSNGALLLNGNLVSAGQMITYGEIDAGQLTYVPGANGSGSAYAAFDFVVNAGNQSLTILTGASSAYTLNSTLLTPTDNILVNENNFGPTGIYSTHLQFGSTAGTIDAGYLSGGEILFGGYVSDGVLDAGELAAIDGWVSAGGVLISTSDSASYDSIAEHFGLVIGGTASSTWEVAAAGHAIVDGPFGSVGNIGDPISASGTISYFDSASLQLGDVVIANDSASGEPTIVLRQQGAGWILFTSDEGIFRSGMTGDGSLSTPNDILAANIFAWAADTVPETSHQMDINVSAVNDAPTFGSPGFGVLHDATAGYNQNLDSLVLSDGSILITPYDTSFNSTIAKLNPDGTLDTSFGTGGYFENSGISYIQSIREQPDGKILVAGGVGSDIALVRFNADGSLDVSFGTGGVVTTDLGGTDEITDVELQTDGKIVAAGRGAGDSVVLRYNGNGTLDTSFDTDGIRSFALGGSFEQFDDLEIQSDGKIIIVGETSVIRLNTDGSLDTSFDSDGILAVGYSVTGVVTQTDGKLVVVGDSGGQLTLSRFNANGTDDLAFGTSGSASWLGTGLDSSYGVGIAQQADGKLVVAGNVTWTGNWTTEWAAVRFDADGSLDTSFGTDGAWVMPQGEDYSEAYSISLFDDGGSEKIVIGGYTSLFSFSDSAVVWLNADGSIDTSVRSGLVDNSPTFVEGGPAVVLDNDVFVVDPDIGIWSGSYDGFSLTLVRNGGASIDDAFEGSGLLGALTEGGNLVYDGSAIGTVTTNSNGLLVLTFDVNSDADTVARTLSSLAYNNSSATPPTSVQIDWTLDDGGDSVQIQGGTALQATGSTTVNITSVNNVPIVTIGSVDVEFTEQNPVGIDINISVNDADDVNLEGATVRISSGYEIGVDSLNWTPQPGISGSFDAPTGILTLTGTATVADYQTLLRTVSFVNSSENPDTTTRTVEVIVDDGTDTSAAVTRDINITAVNDEPTTPNAAASGPEDSTLTITLSGSDIDGTVASFEISTLPSNGALYLDAGLTNPIIALNSYAATSEQLTLYFSPDADWAGVTTFSFSANDNQGNWDKTPATATLTVTSDNDAPNLDLDFDNSTGLGPDFNATWVQGFGPVVIADSDAVVSDVDHANLTSLRVTLTNPLNAAFENLSANVTGTSITADYDSGTSVLTLSGTDSVANYQQVLRTIAYNNTLTNPIETDRVITFEAFDGQEWSSTATTTLSIVNPAVAGVTITAGTTTGIGEQTTISELSVHSSGTYLSEAVAIAADGSAVVVWTSDAAQDGDSGTIMGRLVDAQGDPIGSEFVINSTGTGWQSDASIAMDAAGNFVVTWASWNQDGSSGGTYAQRFDNAGVALGSEFLVNTTTAGSQHYSSIAMADSGEFVIAWSGTGADDAEGIFAQRYDANGVALGSEFRINETTANTQDYVQIASDADGNFVATWTSQGQDGSGRGTYMRLFDATGVAITSEQLVNTSTSGDQWISSVAMNASGDFVVTWRDDGVVDGIYMQRYSADGTKSGGEVQVQSLNGGGVNYPQAAIDDAGNITIVWEDFVDSHDYGIVARQFDASGTPLGTQFVVNTHEQWYQEYPAISMNGDGQFVVVFTDYDANSDGGTTVEMRRFGAATTEDGGVASFGFVLDTQPTDDVTITLSMPDGTEGFLSTTTLTFTSADWNITQVVTVTGVNDALADGNVTHQLLTSNATSLDGNYNGLDVRDLNVTNLDNDPSLDLDADDSSGEPGTSFSTTWTEGGGAVAIVDVDAVLGDADSQMLSSLIVTITNQWDGAAETLSADTTGTSIGASYDGATGVLTLSGGDTVANYQQVLRTITYNNSHGTPVGGERVVEFFASDGANTSPVATSTVSMATDIGVLVVTSLADTVNGDTSDIDSLLSSSGGDGISLREALLAVNNTANTANGPDVIRFDVAGAGPHTINLTSALPTLTDAVLIDGMSEPDFGGTPMVVLNGSSAGTANGLTFGAGSGGSTVSGLVINQFSGNGIRVLAGSDANTFVGNYIGLDTTGTADLGNGGTGILVSSATNLIGGASATDRNVISGNGARGIEFDGISATNNQVIGNYIGTDALGTVAVGNANAGVRIDNGATNNVIGGTNVTDRNIISGNLADGIYVTDAGTSGNQILGNFIGTDTTGTTALGNTDRGIQIEGSATNTFIGGAVGGAGNVISSNGNDGIMLSSGSSTTLVQGNFIGTDLTGTVDLGNGTWGIRTGPSSGNLIGGSVAGAGNTIAFNTQSGIAISDGTAIGNSILGNAIYANDVIGIDINADGVTANDTDDVDSGANNLQNYPVLTSVATNGIDQLVVAGSLNTNPNSTLRIEFFASASADGTGYGEAERYLDFVVVTADVSGEIGFNAVLSALVANGESITATATVIEDLGQVGIDDRLAYGDSSEFSQNQTAVQTNAPILDLDEDNSAAAGTGFDAVWSEGGGPVAIADSDAMLLDLDSSTLTALTVAITNPLDGVAELLSADTTGTGIVANYNAGTGVLSLTGSDSVANYQQVLRTVTYNNTSEGADATTRLINFQASDGTNSSAVVQAAVAMTVSNDAPTLVNNTLTISESGSVVLSTTELSATDPDNLAGALTFTVSSVVGGQFEAVASPGMAVTGFTQQQITDGEIQFVHDGGEAAPAYNVVVTDGALSTGTAPASISFTNVNDAPTGVVTIDNLSPAQGDTLTVSSTLADADGLSGPIGYQWYRDGVAISGATGATYTTVQADVGGLITAIASYTDDQGTAESVTSAATAAVTNVNDVVSGQPVILGTVTEDQTLTIDSSGISDSDGLGAFNYQWYRNGVAIGGATANSYTLGDADVGANITAEISYTDGQGSSEATLSTAVGPVTNVNDAPSGSVTIDNLLPLEGDTLTASNSLADADGLSGPVSYQWYRDGVAISGATGTTYVTAQVDVGAAISVVSSYTDDQGTAESVSSTATAAVVNVNDPVAGQPAILGIQTEDQTLTADTGGISDEDGLGVFNFQWYRDGVAIGGATSGTHVLDDADVGAVLTVSVAYIDGYGNAEATTSIATGLIANVNDLPTGSVNIDNLSPVQGDVLTVSNTLADVDGLSGPVGYQWYRDGVAISGATGTTYTTAQADVGSLINAIASYTDDLGTMETVASTATAAVTNVNDAVAGQPTILGTTTEDQILTIDTSGISDADGLGAFSYQWYRDGVAVSGASAATYLLDDADVGTNISVAVSFTDGYGAAESTTSIAVGLVSNLNDSPSGTVSIDNLTPSQGDTLTASNTLADADGLSAPISYQWYRDGLAISGAGSSSYTTTQVDVGAVISVVAGYTDDRGSAESVTSVATATVVNVNDAVTGQPVIIGTPIEDQILTIDTAGINDIDGLGAFSYQWYRDGLAISGATAGTLTLGDFDVGTNISVQVSYTDGYGAVESTTSLAVGPIANINDAPMGSVAIDNLNPAQGDVLTASNSLVDADGLSGPIGYQWYRDGVSVSGATNASYTTTQVDVGAAISVVAYYTDNQGTAESVTSSATAAVVNVNDAVTGQPVILGTPIEDQTLTIDTSGINDVDGLGAFNYQWYRDGVAIVGATSGSMVLGDQDVGASMTVTVSFVDSYGAVENATSLAVGPVGNINDAPLVTPGLTFSLLENSSPGTLVGLVTATDIDPESTLSGWNIVSGNSGGAFDIDSVTGEIRVADSNNLDFESNPLFSLGVTVSDGSATSAAVNVAIILMDSNEAPVAGNDQLITSEDNDLIINATALLANDSDPEGLPLGLVSISQPNNGIVIDQLDGTWRYQPNANFHGVERIGYTVSDGVNQTVAELQIAVNSVNDVPEVLTPNVLSIQEGQTDVATISVLDADGDLLTFTLTGGADADLFDLDSASGSLGFSNVADFDVVADANQDNLYEIQVTVSDGNGGQTLHALQIDLQNVNEMPTLMPAELVGLNTGDNIRLGQLTAVDPDTGDTLSFEITGGDAQGLFQIDEESGELFKSATDIPIGLYQLQVQVTDAGGLTAAAVVEVTITNPTDNDGPIVPGGGANSQDNSRTGDQSRLEQSASTPSPDSARSSEAVMTTSFERNSATDGALAPGMNFLPEETQGATTNFPSNQAGMNFTQMPLSEGDAEATRPSGQSGQPVLLNLRLVFSENDDVVFATAGALSTQLTTLSFPVSPELSEALDDLAKAALEDNTEIDLRVSGAVAGTVSLSAGFVIWMLRGGSLLASLLTSKPMWTEFDPLPVFSGDQTENEPDHPFHGVNPEK